jgi:hypothetical protein
MNAAPFTLTKNELNLSAPLPQPPDFGLWSARLPSLSGTPMPTPLQLSDTEMAALMDLARPLDPAQRPQFLEAVAAELEVKRQAGEIGEGSVHRVGRDVQRKYFDPPQLGESKYRA